MRIGRRAIFAAADIVRGNTPSKFIRFARGQKCVIDETISAASALDRTRPTVWIHAASLGEFGIARPIIRKLRDKCSCNIVVTFFSPTGYEALKGKADTGIDAVLYLPFDTNSNVKKFLDNIRPDCAVFMVSEYWHNYLNELHRRAVPTYLVSAVIRPDSSFFKWYGKIYRRSIGCFDEIFTFDNNSRRLLDKIGIKNVTVNGDPLFDNVNIVARTPWEDKIIENFAAGEHVFIAGSLHDDEDLELVTSLANRHRDTRFIIVPHEINSSILTHIKEKLDGKSILYSECDASTDFGDMQVLVIDFVGALAYIYRYGTLAYVGGGFTKLLHSVIEPAVYGMPVAFGPNVNRKAVTRRMIELGIGRVTDTPIALDNWFSDYKDNPERLAEVSGIASTFVKDNVGATDRVVHQIMEDICAKS
ncbi:MAG: 3-deoxy-D-manno-octulosonic acid transferase [Bacteroides sp.]|nr:3-deoxy-D-manno-octulosonic acid transferase [Bacteroides sp.]